MSSPGWVASITTSPAIPWRVIVLPSRVAGPEITYKKYLKT